MQIFFCGCDLALLMPPPTGPAGRLGCQVSSISRSLLGGADSISRTENFPTIFLPGSVAMAAELSCAAAFIGGNYLARLGGGDDAAEERDTTKLSRLTGSVREVLSRPHGFSGSKPTMRYSKRNRTFDDYAFTLQPGTS
ncbi:hypothetical protein ACROYT_G029049 [Oculina patagonica]